MTPSKPSKSARKREYLELQQLGEQLIGASNEELRKLVPDETLRKAIQHAGDIRSHGALRRQKQLIGKLMHRIDAAPIREALAARSAREREVRRLFANAERWRDRIVRDGQPAVDEFVAHAGSGRSQLLANCGELDRAVTDAQEKIAKRRIFRCVHDALMLAAQNDRLPR